MSRTARMGTAKQIIPPAVIGTALSLCNEALHRAIKGEQGVGQQKNNNSFSNARIALWDADQIRIFNPLEGGVPATSQEYPAHEKQAAGRSTSRP